MPRPRISARAKDHAFDGHLPRLLGEIFVGQRVETFFRDCLVVMVLPRVDFLPHLGMFDDVLLALALPDAGETGKRGQRSECGGVWVHEIRL